MVRRANMTPPRVRLTGGANPTAAIERLYGASQLDRGNSLVSVGRDGVLRGSPTGLGKAVGPYAPQSPEDRRGAGYSNDVPRGWLRGGDGTKQANFDHSPKRGGR